eukprot:scaffold6456_cov98-Skeletonema_dohrnii-CCMP3373.AAC.1
MQWLKGDVCLLRVVYSPSGKPAFFPELKKAIGDLMEQGIGSLGVASLLDNKGNLLRNDKNFVVQGVLFTVDLEGDESDEVKRQIVHDIAEKIGDLYCRVTKPFSNATTKAKPFSYRVGYCDMSEKYLDQVVSFNDAALAVARMYHDFLANDSFDKNAESIIGTFFHIKENDDFDKAKAEVLNAYETHVKHE